MKKDRSATPGVYPEPANGKKPIAHIFAICLPLSLLFLIALPAPAYAEFEKHEASFIPWSGYWWPTNEGGLATGNGYYGHPAPMEKYELWTEGDFPGDLTNWYLTRSYNPSAPFWYGLCVYWARAAVHENFEFYPSSEDNIVFRVGDKKGLLTYAHENDLVERGDGLDPSVFHFWLLSYIKDQGKPFVADLETVDEVWSYPIFAYEMETKNREGVQSVTVTLFYSDDFVKPDFMGAQILQKTLTYDLFVSDDDAIYGGEWTGAHANDPPRQLSVPLAVRIRAPGMEIDKLRYLAGSKDDPFENSEGSAADIYPGAHNLVLLDEDLYRVGWARPGDQLRVGLEKKRGSYEGIAVEIRDGSGELVQTGEVLDAGKSFDAVFPAENPPYTVRVTQPDYDNPNIYRLKVDVIRPESLQVPFLPKNGMWSGFALANPTEDRVENVILTTYDSLGDPVQTVYGPLAIGPGENKVFLFSDLPSRKHEIPEMDRISILSDGDLAVLNLFGHAQKSLACFNGKQQTGNRLVFPVTSGPMNSNRSVFSEVTNLFPADSQLDISIFNADGSLFSRRTQELRARESLYMKGGIYPFLNMPDNGWIEISSQADLSGYQYVSENGDKAESLYALGVDSRPKVIAHVPPGDYWKTRLTLINPSDEPNQITLHPRRMGENRGNDWRFILNPREKRSVEIQERFGDSSPADPSYHSLLDVESDGPVAGYVTYVTPGDEASIPLQSEKDWQARKTLPHYAGKDQGWWTGVALYNPMDFPVSVDLLPMSSEEGEAGQVIEAGKMVIHLEAGEYTVFSVKEKFGGEMAGRIGFINFSADRGKIGGFYVYGNETNSLLSGAGM